MDKLAWLGMFDQEPVGLHHATPAQILQQRTAALCIVAKLRRRDQGQGTMVIRVQSDLVTVLRDFANKSGLGCRHFTDNKKSSAHTKFCQPRQ